MIRRPRSLILLALVLAAAAGADRAAGADDVAWTKYHVRSPATGKVERFWVGHRKGLDPDGAYPVLYFLPGLLGDEDKGHQYFGPHVAKYDLILVSTSVGGSTWFMDSPHQPWMKWGAYLRQELRAFVEAKYPASRQKGQRGIMGISAGGHAAFYHAITHPDLYGNVTVISGAMDLRGYAGAVGLEYWIGPRAPAFFGQYKDRSCVVLAAEHTGALPFALAMEAGDKDGALQQMLAFRRVLNAKGIAYHWHVGAGGHSWTFWKGRIDDLLAWNAKQFDHHRRENLYAQETEAGPSPLEVIEKPPQVALSDEAVARLRAPWTDAKDLKPVKTGGLPDDGAPLRKAAKEETFAEAEFGADLPVRGHDAGLFLYRLTLTVAAPLPKAGTVALSGRLRNGRRMTVLTSRTAHLPVPAGKGGRQVEVRARIAVELKEPDPIRGGIVVGIQPIDSSGQPVGEPVLGKARPGTSTLERWPIAPQARTLWTVTLEGDQALPLAAIHGARLEAEP